MVLYCYCVILFHIMAINICVIPRDVDCLLRTINIKTDNGSTATGTITHYTSELTPMGAVYVQQLSQMTYTVPRNTAQLYSVVVVDGKINFFTISINGTDYVLSFLVLCALTKCFNNLAMKAYCSEIVNCANCDVQKEQKEAEIVLHKLSNMISATNLAYATVIGSEGLVANLNTIPAVNATDYGNSLRVVLQLLYKTTKYSLRCNTNCSDALPSNHCSGCV